MIAGTRLELTELVATGARVKYLHFWGHKPQPDGSAGAGCLSQWWPAEFTVDGRVYATAEHWMMWSKAVLFGDADAADRVLAASHPHRAKAIGREVRGFDQGAWEAERLPIVVAGSIAKFAQHPDLGAFLLGTGERVLVEASPLDRIWGIGLGAADPRAHDPARWRGLNLLGFALMRAREELRARGEPWLTFTGAGVSVSKRHSETGMSSTYVDTRFDVHLRGLLSFPLTPFTDADTVDLDTFASHIETQIAWQPSGLFVACGTGEFTALDLDEYSTVVATAVQVAAGRTPVFAGTGGGPRIAARIARLAADAGADGLLVLPPYLVTSTPAGLVRHVAHVAAATSLPLAVYQRANAVLDPAAAVALLDLPTVAGIKDGRGDVDAMLRLITAIRTSGHPRAAEFGFLNGLPTAELSVRAYEAIGVESYSSAVLCFAPEIATRFYRAIRDGDQHAQDTLLAAFYLPLVALRDRVPGYAVSLVKAGARLRGLPAGPVRPPLIDPTPAHLDELAGIIDAGLAALDTL